MGRNSVLKERKNNPVKRAEIVIGLIEFFRNHSLADSNMDEISVSVGKSKATLYKYFKSKEEMVEALIGYKVEKITGFVGILHNESLPFFDRYEQSFALLHEHIGDISNEFIDDLRNVFPEIYKQIELLIDLAVKELAEYYEVGMSKGIFNSLNAKMLSQMDLTFFQILTDPKYLRENNLTVGQAFQDFYAIRCMGLLAK